MNTKKKIILLFAIFSLFIFIYSSITTYSKYDTEGSATVNASVARWYITLNGKNINESKEISIDEMYTANTKIADEKIAPGIELYFDVTIDGSNTDVNYAVLLKFNQCEKIPDLQIVNYQEIFADDSLGTMTAYDYSTGIIFLTKKSDSSQIKKYRFYVKWIDQETGETMNNAADTKIVIDDLEKVTITGTIFAEGANEIS